MVLAAVAVVLSLSLTILAGEPPREYLSVEDARSDPGAREGPVEVVAVVVEGSVHQTDDGLTRFSVRGETNATMNVTYDEGLTDAFGSGKWITMTGSVVEQDGQVLFEAEDVQVGCPSKWRSEKAA